MAIRFPCDNPACARSLNVADDSAGKRIRCPACKHVSAAPSLQTQAPKPRAAREPAQPARQPALAGLGLWLAVGTAGVFTLLAIVTGATWLVASSLRTPVPRVASLPTVVVGDTSNAAAEVGPEVRVKVGVPPEAEAAKSGPAASVPAPPAMAIKPRRERLRYLPDETLLFATMNVEQLLRAPLLRDAVPTLKKALSDEVGPLNRRLGFDLLNDVTRISAAGSQLRDTGPWFVLVQGRLQADQVRAALAADPSWCRPHRLELPGGRHHDGFRLVSLTQPWYLTLLGPDTLALSNQEAWLVAALEEEAGRLERRLKDPALQAALESADAEAGLWAAGGGAALEVPAELGIELVTVRLRVTDAVDIDGSARCADPAAANLVSQLMAQALPKVRGSDLAAGKGFAQLPVLVDVLKRHRPQVEDRTVRLAVRLTPMDLAALGREPEDLTYRYRNPNPGQVGVAHHVTVREEANGTLTVKGFSKDSVVPFSIDLSSGVGKAMAPGAPGSTDLRVVVNPQLGYTTLAGLRFQDNATVNVRADGTVQVDRAGVRADAAGSRYVSRRVDDATGIVMAKVPNR